MKRSITALIGAILFAVALTGTGCIRHWHDDHYDRQRDSRNHHGDYRDRDDHRDRYDHRYR